MFEKRKWKFARRAAWLIHDRCVNQHLCLSHACKLAIEGVHTLLELCSFYHRLC
jgi:hypothetical protein